MCVSVTWMFLNPLPWRRYKKPWLNVTRKKFQEITPTWPDIHHIPGLLRQYLMLFAHCPSLFESSINYSLISNLSYASLLASDLRSFWCLQRFTLAEVLLAFSFLSLLSLLCGSFLSFVRSWLPCCRLLPSVGDEQASRSIVTSLWKRHLEQT